MKIVVTGGIGSGKSTVCKILSEKLKYKYFSFDEIVHEAYKNEDIKKFLNDLYGTSERKEISQIMWKNKDELHIIESIFEPIINFKLNEILIEDDFVLEFPLLFEKGQAFLNRFDYIISVITPKHLQIERISQRDDRSIDTTLAIIESQTNDTLRLNQSDLIIYNGINAKDNLESEIVRVVKKIQNNGKKIGVVSGSFDPITLGHTWIIQKALDVMDYVIVAIASNTNKNHMFDQQTRLELVENTLKEVLTLEQLERVTVDFIPKEELVVSYAAEHDAKFIFRGLRNATDLEYENQLNLIQKKIAPDIETVFLMTPRELIEISSSVIKSSISLREWERVASPYISKCVLVKLREISRK